MTIKFYCRWISYSVLVCLFTLFSCASDAREAQLSKNTQEIKMTASDEIIVTKKNIVDTVTVLTAEKLIKNIRSNRIIRLIGATYILKSSLLIDSIENLKILGTDHSRLSIKDKNTSVIKLTNSNNIHLENLIIGQTESPGFGNEHGVVTMSHAHHIHISDCKIFGFGTIGLITRDVNNFIFSNSEITACTAFIFELESSRRVEFIDIKFHDNHLTASVLGAFTYSTKEVTFLNCAFLNNEPEMPGNPAFNFLDNYKDFNDPIIFRDCTFKNNKGFKWYGEKIQLTNCKIDSTDFIGLKGSYYVLLNPVIVCLANLIASDQFVFVAFR